MGNLPAFRGRAGKGNGCKLQNRIKHPWPDFHKNLPLKTKNMSRIRASVALY